MRLENISDLWNELFGGECDVREHMVYHVILDNAVKDVSTNESKFAIDR